MKYQEVRYFIESNHKNPSKYAPEEMTMVRLKQQRKLLNAGALKPERIERFKDLLALMDGYKRINQYM